MEKGSHNLIPFSHTRMVIPQIYLGHVFNENWYTYVNDSLANTMGISTSTIQQFRKNFCSSKGKHREKPSTVERILFRNS